MNLKSKIITLIIVLCMFVSGSAYAQGFFKNKSTTTEQSTTTNNGLVRAPGQPPTDEPPGNESTPVGEGLAILSLLSGGYFMLKKRNLQK